MIVGERGFAGGDRVLTRINREGAVNRERWDVLHADGRTRTLRLRRLGDGHTLTLGPSYLDRRRDDNGPAFEYAYALIMFGAQGKTVDRVYPFLDPGADLEQGLVALSRGREFACAYAVASSELLDPDLGPDRREISDDLHDIRAAIEREGNDFAAIEFGAREKVARMSDAELGARRAELATVVGGADPLIDRRERLRRSLLAEEALAWHRGAHAIAAYRRRYDVREVEEPLGDRPRSASQRVEHEAAMRRIEAARRRLGQGAEHGLRHSAEIDRGVGR